MTEPLLHPVATRTVRPAWATRVVSPAYDSVRADVRRELMARDPYVFLHVTRSPGDVEGERDDELGDRNAEALERLLAADLFTEVNPPSLYLYRLRYGIHEQTAVVGDIALAATTDGRIRPHERVRPQRSVLLADHLDKVAINSSPIALGYRDIAEVDAIVAEVSTRAPLLDFEREDQLGQTVWRVPDDAADRLRELLAEVTAYIVDGHHRVAASVELWKRKGAGEVQGRVLGALFPVGQLRVCAFHRRVADLNGLDATELVAAVEAAGFHVAPLTAEVDPTPAIPGEFGMYVEGVWYRLSPLQPPNDPGSDATLLQTLVLGPVLDVDEAGTRSRLDYLPGNTGVSRLVDVVDEHGGVAFALHPVPMSHLMAVADAGETLPPKSTYFEPKVRSGVFVSPR